jgi:hypothetical protein
MNTIYVDSRLDDEARRERLYGGQLFVFTPRASTRALCDFAREMIEAAFGGQDPTLAQYDLSVERFVEIFAPLKPAFIHHPRTLGLIRDVIDDLGCDLDATYIDVPRLRGVTSHGYLTSGVGYAHHLHRDTWYSAPMAQLNWWLPIFDFESESSMAFHPKYWSEGVPNGSDHFNYYEWNATGRKDAAKQITSDTRKQPKAEIELDVDPQTRIVCQPGGIVLFAGAQMHSTVPNSSGRTRFSMDFRTVNAVDLAEGRAAPNVDSHCHGTSLRDFRRARDLAPMPDELVAQYDDVEAPEGVLVFGPSGGGVPAG